MTHHIRVEQEILSDGSDVYNVRFSDIKLAAVTEHDANLLADKIAAAINEHTNDEAIGKYVW